MAYLSYNLILHYKKMHIYLNAIVILMDVKHVSDKEYQPIIVTILKDLDFSIASRPAFLHIFENFQNYKTYTQIPKIQTTDSSIAGPVIKRKNVTFNELVKVRHMSTHLYEYGVFLKSCCK